MRERETKRLRGRLPLAGLVLALALGLYTGTLAQNLIQTGYGNKHRPQIGLKGGIINQTDFHAVAITEAGSTAKLRTRVGFSWQLFFDLPVRHWLIASLSFEMQDIHVFSERHQMLDIGLSLKRPIYKEASQLAWRPVIGIGYAYLGQGQTLEKSGYTTLRAGLEGIFYAEKRHAFLGEFIVYGSISGGNDDHDITFGPVVLLRLGVIY